MKHYDYKKAKETIKSHLNNPGKHGKLVFASLGMEEDWNWTAETIWSNNKYSIKLKKDTLIAGIKSSNWATPVLELDFEDEFTIKIPCYKLQDQHE